MGTDSVGPESSGPPHVLNDHLIQHLAALDGAHGGAGLGPQEGLSILHLDLGLSVADGLFAQGTGQLDRSDILLSLELCSRPLDILDDGAALD